VTLFSDDRPTPLSSARVSTPDERRRRKGWTALGIGFIALAALALWPSSYVIQQPGPVYDTLGTAEHEDEQVPLITIDDAETYPTGGALDLLTVQVVGNPEQRVNWFEVAASWFDPARMVVPVDQIFPPNQTVEQRNEQNAELMVDSQQDAIAAALSELDYDIGAELAIGAVAEGSPAEGALEVDDLLVAVNGQPVTDVESVRAALAENGVDQPASFDVITDGSQRTVEVTPVEATTADGAQTPIVGITTRYNYDFPIDVTIQLDSVGGPSAGMMFALGIIDKLTPDELNGGANIAGTGTITADGMVGPIGGIRQKLYGASDAGAEVFLSPESNCGEVVGHVPSGLDVYSVGTLDDALSVLEAVRSDSGFDELATCDTVVAGG
jgi:PDZ domain-containing protein